MKKFFQAVLVAVMLVLAVAMASASAPDSHSVFFADKAKYTEKKAPNFEFDAGAFKQVVGYLQAEKTALAFVRGYATKNEGYKQADFHRRLNNVSAGDYRASYFIDLVTSELPWLKGRIRFLPAVVDSTRRGVMFWAEPTGLASADDVADALNKLGNGFGRRLGKLASADSALDARVSDLEGAELERRMREALATDTPRWIRFGFGVACVGVSFSNNQQASFATPVAQLDLRLSERFTAHAIGGVIKTTSTPKLFGGMFTATIGYRVWKSVELNSGYTLASEFNSDFQYGGPGMWRTDCATAGLALNIGLGHGIEIQPHASVLYAGDNTWGVSGGASIVF